jgi:hypothetical protein
MIADIVNAERVHLVYLLFQVTVLAVSCGGEYTEPEIPQLDYMLVLIDSIGQETGDTNYIIGLISEVEYFPNGNIAVLDKMKNTVSIFNSTGGFVANVGSRGDGPGQFHIPYGLAIFPDGSMIVSDANSMNIFDSSFSVVDKLTTTHTVRVISAFNNGDYFGTDLRIETHLDEPMFANNFGRWSRNCDLLTSYTVRRVPPSVLQQGESGVIKERDRMFSCASESGVAFFTEASSEEFTIYGYNPEGIQYITINDPEYRRIARTDDEIERIIQKDDAYNSVIFGSSVSSQFEYRPLPYRPAINGMFFDHESRLWVRLGYFRTPIFRVYSINGEVLFHVGLEVNQDGTDYSSWEFVESEFGIIGYDKKPEEYVRFYLFRMDAIQ